jgi:hypothetical protein
MTDNSVASFADAHDRKHGPDPAHVWRDEQGVKWLEFCCEFRDGDKTYGFSIWATDFADAERRMALLRASAVVAGQLYTTVPS